MSHFQFRLFLTFLLVSLTVSLYSQDIPGDVTPATVTDQQLENAVEKAEQQGYSQQQIESLARARGLSEVEISNLRQRIQNLQAETDTTELDEAQLREELGEFDLELEDLTDKDRMTDEIEGKIFGSELFNNRGLSFAPSQNIPTPNDYQVGPGDELIVDIWGASENTYQLTVGPEGSVKVPKLGPVYVNGLKMEQASSKLLSRLSQIYAGLNDSQYGAKNTYAQVSLGRIRSIKVNIIGEVKSPGTYTISSLSTVLHALYQAGGLTRDGAYRQVQVFRFGKIAASFDIYDYLFNGDIGANIMLQDQDLIKVPVYEKRIRIAGEVKNPAIYELKGSENLQTVIDFAGGFTDEAYTRLVTVRRRTDNARRILTIKSANFGAFDLNSGDAVSVAQILDVYENRVIINGAVWRPGEYELTDSLTLSELITKVEGITADAFMERGQILRYNEDLSLLNIEFSIREVMAGTKDILLYPEDVVNIKSIFSLQDQYNVQIQGEVRNPGVFPFQDSLTVEDIIFKAGGFAEAAAKSFVEVSRRTTEDNSTDYGVAAINFQFPIDENLRLHQSDARFMLEPYDVVTIRQSPFYSSRITVQVEGEVVYAGKYVVTRKDERISDLIRRAGGFTDFAYLPAARLVRFGDDIVDGVKLAEIMESPGSVQDLILRDGDRIVVPNMPSTVEIRGAVFQPSRTVYDKSYSFDKFISQAGGFLGDAKKSKTYVIYPNGEKARTKKFLWFKDYPKVEPGSVVMVPAKPEKDPVSLQGVLGVTSSLLTMVLIIDRLTN